jgi:hypothetical protein
LKFTNREDIVKIELRSTNTWKEARIQICDKLNELYLMTNDGKLKPENMALIKRGRDLLWENSISYYNPKDGENVFVVFRGATYIFVRKADEMS